MEQAVFYILAAIILGSALCVVLLRSVLHCALFLGLALLGVAGIFGSLGADFLFAAQILLYVSGIAVLILYVVMLAGRKSELNKPQTNNQWVAALLICCGVLWGLWGSIAAFRGVTAPLPARPTTDAIGRLLMGAFAVPFELISLILIAALVGAILFTRQESG
ncbi:MAG: NADH-quinone oxidoreductase subunit J [Elusimicrobiota bacterium]